MPGKKLIRQRSWCVKAFATGGRRKSYFLIYTMANSRNGCVQRTRNDFARMHTPEGAWSAKLEHEFRDYLDNVLQAMVVEVEIREIAEAKRIRCLLCGKLASRKTAHRFQGNYVGDECCWEERLRATE